MSGWSVNLTTLFLGRLRPPKRLTRTSCTYFSQYLTTALLEKAEGETKVSWLPDRVSNPGPLTYESGALPIALRGPAYLGLLDRKIKSFELVSSVGFEPLTFLHERRIPYQSPRYIYGHSLYKVNSYGEFYLFRKCQTSFMPKMSGNGSMIINNLFLLF